jgi:hypothetical protein
MVIDYDIDIDHIDETEGPILVIAEGATVTLESSVHFTTGLEMTIKTGATLYSNGEVTVRGKLNNEGRIVNGGKIINKGRFNTSEGTVDNQGVFDNSQGEIIGSISGNKPIEGGSGGCDMGVGFVALAVLMGARTIKIRRRQIGYSDLT